MGIHQKLEVFLQHQYCFSLKFQFLRLNASKDNTTPLPIMHFTLSCNIPEGIRCKIVVFPSTTRVCPALCPP